MTLLAAWPVDAQSARAWLAQKVGVDLFGTGFYADPDDVLREAIKAYGRMVIVVTPEGKPVTLEAVFERYIGPFEVKRRGKRA